VKVAGPSLLRRLTASVRAVPLRVRRVALGVSTGPRRRALANGVAVDPSHLKALGIARPRHVIDVGANAGQFALACIGTSGIESVVSFEPLREAGARFKRSIRDPRVELREVGLGREPGFATLHISNHDDSSSLLAITELQSHTFPGTETSAERVVQVSTLDLQFAHIQPRTLLKIDVQGFELEVLRGADRTLAAVDWVLCEVSFREFYAGQAPAGEVIALLHAANFDIHGIINSTSVAGIGVQADLLFARQGPPGARGSDSPDVD